MERTGRQRRAIIEHRAGPPFTKTLARRMTEIDIPLSVASQLRYYVYLLVDPRTRRAFYVGKGFRRRVLDHFGDQQRSRFASASVCARLDTRSSS